MSYGRRPRPILGCSAERKQTLCVKTPSLWRSGSKIQSRRWIGAADADVALQGVVCPGPRVAYTRGSGWDGEADMYACRRGRYLLWWWWLRSGSVTGEDMGGQGKR